MNELFRMKQNALMLFSLLVLLAAGCGGPNRDAATDAAAEKTTAETQTTTRGTGAALVVFFSRTGEQYNVGVIEKGNTAIFAEMIAEQTGADLFEVVRVRTYYPMVYDALTDVAKKEQDQKACRNTPARRPIFRR